MTEKGDTVAFEQAKTLFRDRTFTDANGASFSPDWKRCLNLLAHWRRDY